MTAGYSAAAPEAFFLDGEAGQLFALYHPPQAVSATRGAVLLVPPFAEEMNKARPVYATLARALAARGFAVLHVDLYGTGDSAGDFEDARWDLWCRDLARGARWLHERHATAVTLIGLRLGALLALTVAGTQRMVVRHLVLWQPVLDGEKFMTQFLRLRLAAGLGLAAAAGKETTDMLRQTLAAGRIIEVAGYGLSAELVFAVDAQRIETLVEEGFPPIDWIELTPQRDRPLPPASRRIADAWRARGLTLRTHCVAGQPFWILPEAVPVPELIALTVATVEAS
ncbi:MAG TPA: hydrolase 2, exosortase A system-associated [Acidiferrobacterales bacterium]